MLYIICNMHYAELMVISNLEIYSLYLLYRVFYEVHTQLNLDVIVESVKYIHIHRYIRLYCIIFFSILEICTSRIYYTDITH